MFCYCILGKLTFLFASWVRLIQTQAVYRPRGTDISESSAFSINKLSPTAFNSAPGVAATGLGFGCFSFLLYNLEGI